jgi:hypothetical protein
MVSALLGLCFVVADPEKITPENIEVGKVGLFDALTVEKVIGQDLIIVQSGRLRMQSYGYPSKDIGKGKVLSKSQVWRVTGVVKSDGSGNGLAGCYIIEPDKVQKKEKR